MAPDGTPRVAAAHLVLFCLTMSHKKDAMLIQYGLSKIYVTLVGDIHFMSSFLLLKALL